MKNSKTLSRERINQSFNDVFNYPLTILSASMGYGKTTGMQTFLKSKKVQTVWISLQGSDGDETVFWHKLCRGIGRYYPENAKILEGMGFPNDARQVSKVLEHIWDLNDGRVTVIVLDDYHLIEDNTQVVRLTEQLVREAIPDLHIVLLSRTRPRINRSEFLSKGLCLELDTNFLAFTLSEIQEYCGLIGFIATTEQLQQIYRYTKGWISAVYLLLLGLERGIPVTEITDISSLVGDNLFAGFDEETQQVLLKLSVLDRFTLRQASRILNNPQVPSIIAGLVDQNAFLEHDRQNSVYRMHNVLLDFLRETAEMSGMDLRPVCHRAGQWFLEQKDISEAFAFYYRGGKIEELLDYINRMERVDIGYMATGIFAQIYKELPRETVLRYPLPMLQFSCTFLLSGDEGLAMIGFELMDILEKHFLTEITIAESLRRRILGEIEILKILIGINDAEKMVEHSQKAEALLEGGISWVIYKDNEFMMGVPHLLYTYYREVGGLKTLLEWIRLGFPPKVFNGCGSGCKELALSEYALETGDVSNVLIYADKAIIKANLEKQVDIMLASRFVKMRLALLEGQPIQAQRQLEQTEEWFDRLRPELSVQKKTIFTTTMELIRAYIYGCLNQPENIPEWLKTGNISAEMFMYRDMGFPCILTGKAALLEHRWVELTALCEAFIEPYSLMHNQLGLLHNYIYEAVAKYNLYGMEAGLSILLPTLQKGQVDGILLPFVENGQYLLPMLEELQGGNNGLDLDYFNKLISFCKRYSRALKASQKGPAQLTMREKEVLNLLAEGLTQREMADRIHLSVAAVKKHLESIYPKLEVNNKISAVQKAKEAGLL